MGDDMKIFLAVDKDHKGYITLHDLEKYARDNGMNPNIAQKWNIQFDPQNTGKITWQKFCEVLNVDPQDLKKQQFTQISTGKIRVQDNEMSEKMMEDLLNVTKKFINQFPNDLKARAGAIKRYMEQKYGDSWHCFIVTGIHGYHYSHKPRCSITFSCDEYFYVVFSTPLH
uniref:Tegument antigen n=1 Tax=Schistocephalus solidus TaxID=70667 RepID=A0A0X3PK85_SCHSO